MHVVLGTYVRPPKGPVRGAITQDIPYNPKLLWLWLDILADLLLVVRQLIG